MSLGFNISITNTSEQPSTFNRDNTLYVGGSGGGNYTKIQDAIDDAGIVISEAPFSFTTVDNALPTLDVASLCNWNDCSIKPTVSVEISDKYGDKMDLIWYLKKEGESSTIVNLDHNLNNGIYSCELEGADEYDTKYYWKIKVTDEYGLSMEQECTFYTKSG